MERHACVSALVEKIRMCCASLPQLRVQWVEMLIAHAELIHRLWSVQYGPDVEASGQLARWLGQHAGAVQALRRRCEWDLGAPARRPAG